MALRLRVTPGGRVFVGTDIIVQFNEFNPVSGEATISFSAPKHIAIDREKVRTQRINKLNEMTKHADQKPDS